MSKSLSAVHRGAAFEQRSLQLLQTHLSMALRRVGGKADGGIDLVGWWWLPFTTESNPTRRPGALLDPDGLLRRRLRIIAQCKAEKKKFSPKYVREMEGVWHLHSRPLPTPSPASPPSLLPHESAATDMYPTVALLLSESPFSHSTVLHVYRSTVPFLLIHLPCPTSSSDSDVSEIGIGTVCPNPTLTHLVEPLAFCWERCFSAGLSPKTNTSTGGRPGLWWRGHKLYSWVPEFPDSGTA